MKAWERKHSRSTRSAHEPLAKPSLEQPPLPKQLKTRNISAPAPISSPSSLIHTPLSTPPPPPPQPPQPPQPPSSSPPTKRRHSFSASIINLINPLAGSTVDSVQARADSKLRVKSKVSQSQPAIPTKSASTPTRLKSFKKQSSSPDLRHHNSSSTSIDSMPEPQSLVPPVPALPLKFSTMLSTPIVPDKVRVCVGTARLEPESPAQITAISIPPTNDSTPRVHHRQRPSETQTKPDYTSHQPIPSPSAPSPRRKGPSSKRTSSATPVYSNDYIIDERRQALVDALAKLDSLQEFRKSSEPHPSCAESDASPESSKDSGHQGVLSSPAPNASVHATIPAPEDARPPRRKVTHPRSKGVVGPKDGEYRVSTASMNSWSSSEGNADNEAEGGAFGDEMVVKDGECILDLSSGKRKSINIPEEVTHLLLHNNTLTTIFFRPLPTHSIRVLNLSYNLLASLSQDLAYLPALRELYIAVNKFKTFPAVIAHLPDLEVLDLRGNQIDFIPSFIEKLKRLQHLDLRSNSLTYLSPQLCQLPFLTALLVDQNPFLPPYDTIVYPLLEDAPPRRPISIRRTSRMGAHARPRQRNSNVKTEPWIRTALKRSSFTGLRKEEEQTFNGEFALLATKEEEVVTRGRKTETRSMMEAMKSDSEGEGIWDGVEPGPPSISNRSTAYEDTLSLKSVKLSKKVTGLFNTLRSKSASSLHRSTTSRAPSQFLDDDTVSISNSLSTSSLRPLGDDTTNPRTDSGYDSRLADSRSSSPEFFIPPQNTITNPIFTSQTFEDLFGSLSSHLSSPKKPPSPSRRTMSPPPPSRRAMSPSLSHRTTSPPPSSYRPMSPPPSSYRTMFPSPSQRALSPPPPSTMPLHHVPQTAHPLSPTHSSDTMSPPTSPCSVTSPPRSMGAPPVSRRSSKRSSGSGFMSKRSSTGSRRGSAVPLFAPVSRMTKSSEGLTQVMAYLRDLFDLNPATWQVEKVREWKRRWGATPEIRGEFYVDEDDVQEERGVKEVKEVEVVENGMRNPLRRKKIIEEILSTEKKYVHGLEELVDIYINSSPNHLPADGKIVFSNVQNILTFHREHFLPALEVEANKSDENGDLACIGKVFASHVAYMKMYSFYINGFDHAMDIVQQWLDGGRKYKKAKAFLKQCKLNPNHSQLNIQGYLLLPVQRIPRYKMLLKNLLKYTDKTHIDYADLMKATEEMGLRTDEMNEGKKIRERHERVVEIQNQIKWQETTPLVQPHRYLVREGMLHLDHTVRAKLWHAAPSSDVLDQEKEYVNKDFKIFLFNDIMIQCNLTPSGTQLDLVRILYLETRLEPASLRTNRSSLDEISALDSMVRIVDADMIYYFSGERSELMQWKRDINSRW